VVAGYGRGGEEEAVPVEGGERMRRPSSIRLREEKRGGGRASSGPVRRRWPEVHGSVQRDRPSDGARASGAGGRRRGRWAGPGGLGLCRPGGN
jgi:hypothetical protein